MKKNIFVAIAVLAIAAVVSFYVFVRVINNRISSHLEAVNVEILVKNELPTGMSRGYERVEKLILVDSIVNVTTNISASSVRISSGVTLNYKNIVCCTYTGEMGNACDWDLVHSECLDVYKLID